jgi:predicted nucleic acid-binding protein
VRAVVADTGPLHYLALIGAVGLLPRLFETVFVPELVRAELSHPRTPRMVRDWVASRPSRLQVAPTSPLETLPLPELDDGERAAIALALSLRVDLLLMDDRGGVAAALASLKETNFRYRPELLDALLAQHRDRSGGS